MTPPEHDKTKGLVALVASAACWLWFVWSLPPDTEAAMTQMAISGGLGLISLAWGALLLRAPMMLRKLALALLALMPGLVCVGLSLLLSAYWLIRNDDCDRMVGVLSGISMPCEVVYIPLIVATLGIGFGLAIVTVGFTAAWGAVRYGLPVKEKPPHTLRAAKPRAKGMWKAWAIIIVIALGIVSAVAIPQYQAYRDRGRQEQQR